jgi:hypothetical protein
MKSLQHVPVETGCCLRALSTMPYTELISQGYTLSLLNPTSPKGVGGLYSPLGSVSCVRVVVVSQGLCGAVSGGGACGRARFNAINEKEIVQ